VWCSFIRSCASRTYRDGTLRQEWRDIYICTSVLYVTRLDTNCMQRALSHSPDHLFFYPNLKPNKPKKKGARKGIRGKRCASRELNFKKNVKRRKSKRLSKRKRAYGADSQLSLEKKIEVSEIRCSATPQKCLPDNHQIQELALVVDLKIHLKDIEQNVNSTIRELMRLRAHQMSFVTSKDLRSAEMVGLSRKAACVMYSKLEMDKWIECDNENVMTKTSEKGARLACRFVGDCSSSQALVCAHRCHEIVSSGTCLDDSNSTSLASSAPPLNTTACETRDLTRGCSFCPFPGCWRRAGFLRATDLLAHVREFHPPTGTNPIGLDVVDLFFACTPSYPV